MSAEQPARDLRELGWRCLVAIGAGAITGAVFAAGSGVELWLDALEIL